MQVIPLHLPPGDTATERTLHIDGTSEQIKSARELVDEVISEVCSNVTVGRKGFPQFKLVLRLESLVFVLYLYYVCLVL